MSDDFGGETDIGYEPSPPRRPGPTRPPIRPPDHLSVAEAFQHALWSAFWAGAWAGARLGTVGDSTREEFEAWYRRDVLGVDA